jgi:peptidoglycan hydrolase CwlO-like protein
MPIDKKIEIDIDGDSKPDIKIDFKTLAIVAGFIISGTMSYQNLKSEIEIAKDLPKYEIKENEVVNQKIDFLQKEIDNLQEQVKDLENKVYKR